ncbi:hypothetical protein N3K63_05595 [Microbacterium sp. W1N]|uniref:hypothetical protein n=1 Tax=Microbacterium festucae TaxID=2977531 RepID=UPI0021C24EAF|nr:hypothetical protein [Microbacterium festucae]MCT9819760.1 hypothetical protein [Microbacterium festucae]
MGRRTGEQTRELLLRVGMQMLFERGASAGVQHIRLQEVLRRAGLTTGAAYRLWSDQDEYQRELAVAMLTLRVGDPAESARAAVEPLIAAGASGDEVIRTAAEAHVSSTWAPGEDAASTLDAKQFLIALALRTTATTWPELRDASRERHRDSVASYARLYGDLMTAYGLRMKPGLTVEDFTEAMAASGEGFAIHALAGMAHPSFDLDEEGGPTGRWPLFGLVVRALVYGFMIVPDDTSHPLPPAERHPASEDAGGDDSQPGAQA